MSPSDPPPYFERLAAFAELLRRNRARARPVPQAVLLRLAARLDVPDVTEADEVEWVLT